MSARYEQSIQDWYNRSRTANLEHLDLAGVSKIKLSDLSNNIDVIYDRLLLHSKIEIKSFYDLKEKLESLEEKQEKSQFKLLKELGYLRQQVEQQKPLTSLEVKSLVREITKQPKLVEEEALKLTKNLKEQVAEVKSLVQKVKELIAG